MAESSSPSAAAADHNPQTAPPSAHLPAAAAEKAALKLQKLPNFGRSRMLAPIVTKEMKLFPTQPLPPRIKNVRSRAQSLQEFANGNAVHVQSSLSMHHPSTTAAGVPRANGAAGRPGAALPTAVRSRNSLSIGSLPTSNAGFHHPPPHTTVAHQQTTVANANGNSQHTGRLNAHPAAKSPPKYSASSVSLRKPLDSIVEGVELQQSSSAGLDGAEKTSSAVVGTKLQGKMPSKSAPINIPTLKLLQKKDQQKSSTSAQISARSCPHRLSDDGLAQMTKKKKGDGLRTQRTQSMESGRKKRTNAAAEDKTEKREGSSSSAGCFAMWLGSKFSRKGSGSCSSSNSSDNSCCGGGSTKQSSNTGESNSQNYEPPSKKS